MPSVDQGATATTGPLSPGLSVGGSSLEPSSSGFATSMFPAITYAGADTGSYPNTAMAAPFTNNLTPAGSNVSPASSAQPFSMFSTFYSTSYDASGPAVVSAAAGPYTNNLTPAGSPISPSSARPYSLISTFFSTSQDASGPNPTTSLNPTSYLSAVEILPGPYFKMRGLANPGPGSVTWIVRGGADFGGVHAPSAVQAGTVVIADQWMIPVPT